MTAFGEWRAHASLSRYFGGQDVELNIGREVSPSRWDFLVQIAADGASTVETKDLQEGEVPAPSDGPLRIPEPVAEAIYHALDRLYGHQNQDGKVESLQESLDKERSRVDMVLNAMIRPAQVIQAARPSHHIQADS